MRLRKVRASALQVRRGFGNIVRARVLRREHVLPFVAVYHATYRCNAECSFCSREADLIHTNGNGRMADLKAIEEVFISLRKLTSSLYITGGEPLLLENIEKVLKLARQVGFYPIVINTNAILLHERQDVLKYADKVVVSLHTVDEDEAVQTYGVTPKIAQRMIDNIQWAAGTAKLYGNEVLANCVLTDSNLGSVSGVMDFCLEQGIPLAVVPATIDCWPSLEQAEPEMQRQYFELMDRIVAQKKAKPHTIRGTLAFYRRAQRFGSFDCRPSCILTVDPDGHVINPCVTKYAGPTTLGKLNGQESARLTLRRVLNYQAAFHFCSSNCLKMCYAEPALLLENPWLAASEYIPFWLLNSRKVGKTHRD